MWYPGRVDLLGSADDGGRGSSGVVPVCCAPHICGINQVGQINAELNPICHLLALLGAHHIFHVSGLRVKNPMLWGEIGRENNARGDIVVINCGKQMTHFVIL